MADSRSKRALPAVMDVGTFRERFTCPDCGHAGGWWLANRRLVECSVCYRQTSVTAGTVFHGARVPLWKWFWAIYELAQNKKGIAAMTLAKRIDAPYRRLRSVPRRDQGRVRA